MKSIWIHGDRETRSQGNEELGRREARDMGGRGEEGAEKYHRKFKVNSCLPVDFIQFTLTFADWSSLAKPCISASPLSFSTESVRDNYNGITHL